MMNARLLLLAVFSAASCQQPLLANDNSVFGHAGFSGGGFSAGGFSQHGYSDTGFKKPGFRGGFNEGRVSNSGSSSQVMGNNYGASFLGSSKNSSVHHQSGGTRSGFAAAEQFKGHTSGSPTSFGSFISQLKSDSATPKTGLHSMDAPDKDAPSLFTQFHHFNERTQTTHQDLRVSDVISKRDKTIPRTDESAFSLLNSKAGSKYASLRREPFEALNPLKNPAKFSAAALAAKRAGKSAQSDDKQTKTAESSGLF